MTDYMISFREGLNRVTNFVLTLASVVPECFSYSGIRKTGLI